MRNHRGNSLLMLAAYNENVEAVRTLLAHGADPDRVNDKGLAPLAGAAFKGNAVVAQLLLDGGAAPDGPPGTDRTPLMTAAMFDRVNVVELLLNRGADPDRRDGGGLSARDLATSKKADRVAPALARWRTGKAGVGAGVPGEPKGDPQ